METPPNISKQDRTIILQSLSAGLVPDRGLELLAVGRTAEMTSLCQDVESVKAGGSCFRIIFGRAGAGKSFAQSMVRKYALQAGLVVCSLDLTPGHRLHGSGDGKARALLSNIMAHLETQTAPRGTGLQAVIESWIAGIEAEKGADAGGVGAELTKRLGPLFQQPGGIDVATALRRYYEGYTDRNPSLQELALQWLRAEIVTVKEARSALRVERILRDDDLHQSLKNFATFCRLAGYGGFLLLLDELGSLTGPLPNKSAREANFLRLLAMANDALQGRSNGLGFIFAATPEALGNEEHGLFSFEQLGSRLRPTHRAGDTVHREPLVKLKRLGREEAILLLRQIRTVHRIGLDQGELLCDEAVNFLVDEHLRDSDSRSRRVDPRPLVRRFVALLSTLETNPKQQWLDAMRTIESAEQSRTGATKKTD